MLQYICGTAYSQNAKQIQLEEGVEACSVHLVVGLDHVHKGITLKSFIMRPTLTRTLLFWSVSECDCCVYSCRNKRHQVGE